MRRMWIAGLALLTASVAAAETPKPVLGPAEAIAAADGAKAGYQGRFAMTVLATGKSPKATYLNATEDYRAPDAFTFRLAPNVASVLARRYGAPAQDYLKGKRVTVDGIARRTPIVNTRYGRVEGLNRWTHEVYVRLPGQIVSVE